MRLKSGRIWTIPLIALCVAGLVGGLYPLLIQPDVDDSSRVVEISLYCTARVRPPMEEIIHGFQRRTGIRVKAHYDASGELLARLQAGDRGDVFLAGDVFYINEAKQQGFVENAYLTVRNGTVQVTAGVLANSTRKETARQFLEFLSGDFAKDIFLKYDFSFEQQE